MTTPLTHEEIDRWTDPKGPVALCLKQKLLPVEGEGGVIFPPTYADIGYNIDTLSDGTRVATIDSVGSQANRMEPIFKRDPYAALVPQITIRLGNRKPISILDVGHRLGDAIVRASSLADDAEAAFSAYEESGDASLIAKLAPTSLVFGVWDSRGKGAKLPRLVNATIRAWDVDVLHRAATYLPATDFASEDLLGPHSEDKAEKDSRSSLGFQHAPATWTSNDKIPEYREGRPNNDRRILGGIIARNGIYRNVTVNLVALRALGGQADQTLRKYILGLALVAASDPCEEFLRQGCLLTLAPDCKDEQGKDEQGWFAVERSGRRIPVTLDLGAALTFAKEAAGKFGVSGPRAFDFKKDIARKLIDAQKSEKKKRTKKAKQNDSGTQQTDAAKSEG